MRTLSFISKLLMWFFTVLYCILQTLAVFGIIYGNSKKIGLILPIIVSTTLMLAAVILFVVLKKRRYIGLIIGFISSAVMLMAALELGRVFPVQIGASGNDFGLNAWDLIWRHIGIGIIPIFMISAWYTERRAEKQDGLLNKDKVGYDLSGSPIFKDLNDNEEIPPRKLKRSLKKKIEKSNRS